MVKFSSGSVVACARSSLCRINALPRDRELLKPVSINQVTWRKNVMLSNNMDGTGITIFSKENTRRIEVVFRI